MAARARIAGLSVLAGIAFAMTSLAMTGATGSAQLSCTTPECIRGVPPLTADHRTVHLAECSEPKCLSGTDPLWSVPLARAL